VHVIGTSVGVAARRMCWLTSHIYHLYYFTCTYRSDRAFG